MTPARGPDAGKPLDEATLALRQTLPRKPDPVELKGEIVRLAPLVLDRDVETLHALTNGRPIEMGGRSVAAYDPDTLVWRYLGGGPFESVADLRAWMQPQVESADGLPFCVVDRTVGQPVGVACLIRNTPAHLTIEIGGIWYSPIAQRAGANTEATYLLLRHAFGLGYRRVEWKCDSQNERSIAAALKMGFRFEGVQDSHFIVKGRNRNTAWFRILESEWPDVRERLQERLRRGGG